MSYTVCLLTAACLTAQSPTPPPLLRPGATQTVPVVTPETPPPSSPRLFTRIRNFFTGRRTEIPATTVVTTPGKAELGKPMSGIIVSRKKDTPTVDPAKVLSGKDLEKAGHEKDYSWITGRVYRAGNGHWELHYAGPDEVDNYGGTLLLTPKPGMPTLQNGDLICVHGKVSGRAGRSKAGATYDASEINVIEHSRR